jgi:hypothetical protein
MGAGGAGMVIRLAPLATIGGAPAKTEQRHES